MQVPTVKTPASLAEQATALIAAHVQRFGVQPSLGFAELMLGQLALENANGSAVYGWNVGNVTTADLSQPFHVFADLHTDPMGRTVSPDDPSFVTMRFRDYANLAEGTAAYLGEVARRAAMLRAGQAGDALAYATAIRDTSYTPGIDPVTVAKSLTAKAAEFERAGIFARFGLSGPGVSTHGAPSGSLPVRGSPLQGLALASAAIAGWAVFRGF